MCVGVPALIEKIEGDNGPLPMAHIDMAGTKRQCCLAYTPTAEVGDWVLIQNGFAHAIIDPDEARQSLSAIDDLQLITRPGAAAATPSATTPTP